MKTFAEILRLPTSSPFAAAVTIAFLFAWCPLIQLAVKLSHVSWTDALNSFGMTW